MSTTCLTCSTVATDENILTAVNEADINILVYLLHPHILAHLEDLKSASIIPICSKCREFLSSIDEFRGRALENLLRLTEVWKAKPNIKESTLVTQNLYSDEPPPLTHFSNLTRNCTNSVWIKEELNIKNVDGKEELKSQENQSKINLDNILQNMYVTNVQPSTSSANTDVLSTELMIKLEPEVIVDEDVTQSNEDDVVTRGSGVNTEELQPTQSEKSSPSGLVCDICNKTYKTDRMLKNHKYFTHGGKKVHCEPCDKWFTRVRYKQHLESLTHNKDFNVPCPVCKKLLSKKSIKLHMDGHDKTKYCEVCDNWYTEYTYKQHIAKSIRHVSKDDFKFSCDECNSKFFNESAKKRHIDSVHLKLVKYKCSHCGERFKRTYSLKKHILVVHEKKPVPRNYVCDICGSAWEYKKGLADHMVVHTGERPYKCDICDTTFSFYPSLYKHTKLFHEKKKKKTSNSKKKNVGKKK